MSDDERVSAEIERSILQLLKARSAESSICPSEVARAVASTTSGVWRELMPLVRSIAVQMTATGRVRITRKGRELNPFQLGSGPIRLSRGDRFS